MSSKWNPFNAVAPGGFMVNEVLKEKNKIDMPVLSEDQKMELEKKNVEIRGDETAQRLMNCKPATE